MEGHLIQKIAIATGETWTYTYNNLNQLTSATDKAANGTLLSQSSYTLDVFGNRIAQAIYTQASGLTTVTQFAYDNAEGSVPNIWADLDASGSLTTRRIFGDGPDQPLARIDSNGIAWYLSDHLGSIRDITNPAGQLIDHIVYDAFGNIVSETNPSAGDRYKFAGMQYDAVQGDYNDMAREDDPTANRFNQQDPIGVSGANPNLYAYVANDPVNLSDSTGEQIGMEYGPDIMHRMMVAQKAAAPPPKPGQLKMNVDHFGTPASAYRGGVQNFRVQWEIQGGKGSGWIIQHVQKVTHVYNCNATKRYPLEDDLNFWEAWQVVNGKVYANFNAKNENHIDTFSLLPESPCSKGTQYVEGDVKWLPGYDKVDAAHGWSRTAVTITHGLMATKQFPDWQNLKGANGTLHHDVIVSWSDCPPKEKTRILSNPRPANS